MVKPAAAGVPPVFVLSTGRCGSTMISDVLNLHPRVLSLSEFVAYTGIRTFRFRRASGDRMWDILGRQQARTRLMLGGDYEELIYPFGDPNARYTRADIPPILCAPLPHLTDRHDELFDELEPVVRGQPRQPPADHFRALFGWLCRRFGCDTWVERSGGSLLFGSRLLREFPEARAIHVYRDGRETAVSMSRHYLFRLVAANLAAGCGAMGFDAVRAIARSRRWEAFSMRLEPVTRFLFKPDRLPYDRLTLADFGALWSAMIERGGRLFDDLPSDRLLNVRFEDVQAAPETELRRLIRFIDPALEDETWLAAAGRRPAPHAVEVRAPGSPATGPRSRRRAVPALERLGYPL